MRLIVNYRLINGPFGDPLLYAEIMFERRALPFVIGDIATPVPRELSRVSHVFVGHAHMDHFAGFDRLLRLLLGRDKTLALYGPAGFIDSVALSFELRDGRGRKRPFHGPHEVSFAKGLPKHHGVRLQPRSVHQDVRNGPGPEDRLQGSHAASCPQRDGDDHHVGLATRRVTYGVAFGRCDAADLVMQADKNFREHLGDHGIVFDDEDPQAPHGLSPRTKSLCIAHMTVLQKRPAFRDRTHANSLGGSAPGGDSAGPK